VVLKSRRFCHRLSPEIALVVQDIGHGTKLEILKKSRETGGSLFEIQIVPEARCATGRNARLGRIDLPGMEIDYSWLTFDAIQMADSPTGETIGKEAEIPSSAHREICIDYTHSRNRELD
jgi:hypothetical protein